MKLKWVITRARVKCARMIWPRVNPLPPLFEAANGPVTIETVRLFDGDELLCTMDVDVTLSTGNSFSIDCDIEVTTTSGRKRMVKAELTPTNGVPVMLYAEDPISTAMKYIVGKIAYETIKEDHDGQEPTRG